MAERNPILSVLSSNKDFHRPEVTGRLKVFDEADIPASRVRLATQVSKVEAAFAKVFKANPDIPAVAKITLKPDACAKSYRPNELLANNNCPIITVRDFGELLTTATPSGLSTLKNAIATDQRKLSIANISTIEKIEPFTASDAVPVGLDILQEMVKDGLKRLKFKLFQHEDKAVDLALLRAFLAKINELGLDSPEEIHYARGLKIFSIMNADTEATKALANFVGTQSLSPFPSYKLVRKAASIVRPAVTDNFEKPDPQIAYPVLGLIDSGVDPTDQVLSPWVEDRTSYVAAYETDHSHGSFVAGLAIYARQLNHDDDRFPDLRTKIVDVVAIPKDTVPIFEPDILQSITEALEAHPDVRVWNLSLGTSFACVDDAFSDFGMALDQLADEKNVQFVIAAGNYKETPFRTWPAQDLGQADRICGPADSVRGLTVGALAHIAAANSLSKVDDPAPFSRRGPGPMFIPKPEVTHYGGNLSNTGQFAQVGIMSFDGKGNVAEDIGTSFSCPLVASILTHVRSALNNPNRNLVKALVLHSALINSKRSVASEFPFKGFGVPKGVEDLLSCSSNMCTLIFDVDLIPGLVYSKENFPIPACMRNDAGKLVGEFLVTLVYDPPLDPKAGSEYCRTNVEVSLGTYKKGKDGKFHHKKEIPIESGDTKTREKTLVEHGFKWSPTKVYRRNINRGIEVSAWRLNVEILNRSGFRPPNDHKQNMALVITMIGPKKDSPVYDETVKLMNTNGWQIENLQVEQRFRLGY